jgi:hypothetical protein
MATQNNGIDLFDAYPADTFVGKPGDWKATNGNLCTVQASLDKGASAAVVLIEVSNDKVGGLTLATITLDSSTRSDGFIVDAQARWSYVRATLVSVTGQRVIATATASRA